MKFIHISDLHLGKSLHEFSLLDDQEYILRGIINIARAEKPRGALIAGDVFDRSVASAEALGLFDNFLCELAAMEIEVFVISGNHDSADRLAFGSRLMEGSGVHISRVYDGRVEPARISDERGAVDVYLLPFVKPAHVRRFYPDEKIESWTDAVAVAIKNMPLDPENRLVLVAHQFVTGAARCESEELSVGGADNVDAEVFAPFDYVALGHLHAAQSAGRSAVRYCGSPLKYSFAEASGEKSVTVVELAGKGEAQISEIPLAPKREMREVRGNYMDVTSRSFYEKFGRDDYFRVTLTDEDDVPDALQKLRAVYPNLMRLDYDNRRSRAGGVAGLAKVEKFSPIRIFEMLYEERNGRELSETQRDYLAKLMAEVWEDAG